MGLRSYGARLPRTAGSTNASLAQTDDVGAGVQHQVARHALPIIAEKAKAGDELTYTSLAAALGRSRKDARAVAQVCDLLDAAATLARRPLMALWTVRTAAGRINPNAWKRNALPGLRDALLQEASLHTFSDADENAILSALGQLTGFGNRKAWRRVSEVVPQEEMLARLQGQRQMDTLNDLGADEPPVITTIGRRYVRDPFVRAAVMQRAHGACEFCGELGFKRADGSRYLECHHIIALSDDGQDRLTNVIALCPGHHREAHFGENSAEMEKRMVAIVREKEAALTGQSRSE